MGFAGDVVPTLRLHLDLGIPCPLFCTELCAVFKIICAVVTVLLFSVLLPFFRVGYLQDFVLTLVLALVLLVPLVLVFQSGLPVFPIILLFFGVGHGPLQHNWATPSIFLQTPIYIVGLRTKRPHPTGGVFIV